jgi:hypothetical protein
VTPLSTHSIALAAPLSAQNHSIPRRPLARFSALPWAANSPISVLLSQNDVYSRFFIEIFGYTALQQALARNRFERYEELLDTASHAILGTIFPVMAAVGIRKAFARQWKHRQLRANDALSLGFDSIAHIKPLAKGALTRGQKNQLQRYKLGILATELVLMASAAQLFSWGKNSLTQAITGKKAFAGTLTWQQHQSPQEKRDNVDRDKGERKRFWASLAIGYGGNLALPILLWALLKTPVRSSKKALGVAKLFNSHQGIFYSKYTLMWSTVFNDTISTVLSARDKHEKREYMAKYSLVNFFYFIGDDIISGLYAKRLQAHHAKALKGVPLYKKGLWGLPQAIPLDKLYSTLSLSPLKKPTPAQRLAYNLSKRVFWGGLLGTTLCLGASITLANNFYTLYRLSQNHPDVLSSGNGYYTQFYRWVQKARATIGL